MVHDGDNDDAIIFNDVENREWESSKHFLPDFSAQNRARLRKVQEQCCCSPDLAKEIPSNGR
jgi:hypothetical protein